MNATLKAFETFMDEALSRSLPDITLERTPAPASQEGLQKTRVAFNGSGMKAQAFVIATPALLQTTCPLATDGIVHDPAVLKDWLGELGNLVLGRLKNRLLAHEVTIKISAPSFDTNWQKPAGTQTLAVWFRSELGLLGLECVIEGVIPMIGEALKQTAEILPGDAIYRLNDPVQSAPSYDIISKIRSGQGDETAPAFVDELDAEDGHEPIETPSAPARPIIKVHAKPKAQTAVASAPAASAQHREIPRANEALTGHEAILTGVAWSAMDKLVLHFNTGLCYTICPKTLLDQGTHSFVVEGQQVFFEREGELIQVRIPRLNMHFSKPARVA